MGQFFILKALSKVLVDDVQYCNFYFMFKMILKKYQDLFSIQNRKKLFQYVVCCNCDLCFKGWYLSIILSVC